MEPILGHAVVHPPAFPGTRRACRRAGRGLGDENAVELKITNPWSGEVIDAAPVGQQIQLTLVLEGLDSSRVTMAGSESESVSRSTFWSDNNELNTTVPNSLSTTFTPWQARKYTYSGFAHVVLVRVGLNSGVDERDTNTASNDADAVAVVSVTVTSGATQANVTGAKNWATVRGLGPVWGEVVVEATTAPNSARAGKAITWTGGSAVAGNLKQRKVVKDTVAKTNVMATAGATSADLDVWIIWAMVENKVTGDTPPNAVQFGTRYDGTEKLGGRILPDGTKGWGKVVPIGTLAPAGINAIVKAGWGFERRMWRHDFMNGVKIPTRWDAGWQPDTSGAGFQMLVPDADDKIYDRDAPNIQGGAADSVERYDNYEQWVTWGGTRCSDYAPWSFVAWWKSGANPQVEKCEVMASAIELPSETQNHYPSP